MAMETEFAPAERLDLEVVKAQSSRVADLPVVREFLDAMPHMVLVLNECRQIIFANRVFLNFVGVEAIGDLLGCRQGEALDCINSGLLGKRPGEAVGCIRSDLTEGGCGTTLFCRTCGAVRSITNSQQLHALDIQECRMVCGEDQESLDLRVWSRPIDLNGETFTVFSVVDISDEKRRQALERIFFHDVLNTATGVVGLADLLIKTELSEEEIREITGMLAESADQMVDEISAQRMLMAAESGKLEVSPKELYSFELMGRVVRQFHSFNAGEVKNLIVNELAQDVKFVSDPVLIHRVMVNLVKNALEAVEEGETVTVNCYAEGESVCFTVHNSIVMPEDVQRQMFNRSFSTKGSGRGLGTYSIKLITEKYLQGRVSFVSSAGAGTLFKVCYPRIFAGVEGDDEGIWVKSDAD